MQIIEKYDRQFEYLGILIKLLIAYNFYAVWTEPSLDDTIRISDLATLMAFEFIMVHSGFFMALAPRKVTLYALVPAYGLFALGFYASMESPTILFSYLIVVFNRMRFAFSNINLSIMRRTIATSVIALAIFLVSIIAITVNENTIPKYGLNNSFLELSGYNTAKTASGVFIDTPHIAICFGLIYYCTLALAELTLIHYKFSNKESFFLKKGSFGIMGDL